MGVVRTDLRETQEAARRIRFEPTASIPQTNIQQAIEQVQTNAVVLAAAATVSGNAAAGYTPTVVTFAMSPYAPLATDTVLLVDTTGGAVVISMPLSATRLTAKGYVPLTVKDDVGNSDVAAITVNRAGAELLDGLTSYPIDSKYAAVTFMPKAAGGYDVV